MTTLHSYQVVIIGKQSIPNLKTKASGENLFSLQGLLFIEKIISRQNQLARLLLWFLNMLLLRHEGYHFHNVGPGETVFWTVLRSS